MIKGAYHLLGMSSDKMRLISEKQKKGEDLTRDEEVLIGLKDKEGRRLDRIVQSTNLNCCFCGKLLRKNSPSQIKFYCDKLCRKND